MAIKKRLIFALFLILNSCAYRSEPLATFSNRSEIGLASYYGHPAKKIPGLSTTASGEAFDPKQFTAAHKTLPFGSLVKVQNLENDKTIVVRINDRGPFVSGRIVDLSYAAASELDMIKAGKAKVRVISVD